MTSNYSRQGASKRLRQDFGRWLKARREAVGRTQVDLSDHLGHRYYTTVSQFERGISRVPPEDWVKYAEYIGVDPKVFAKRALAHYDHIVFDILYGDENGGFRNTHGASGPG